MRVRQTLPAGGSGHLILPARTHSNLSPLAASAGLIISGSRRPSSGRDKRRHRRLGTAGDGEMREMREAG